MSHPKKTTRTKSEIYLIGPQKHQIMGAKLPSKRQVLSVYFYNTRTVKLSQVDSLEILYFEIRVFWEKARIPISKKQYVILKIQSLVDDYRGVQKTPSARKNPNELTHQREFVEKLDDLFDIVASDALQKLKGIDREFLISQRKKGRVGCLLGIDEAGE